MVGDPQPDFAGSYHSTTLTPMVKMNSRKMKASLGGRSAIRPRNSSVWAAKYWCGREHERHVPADPDRAHDQRRDQRA
jgi:hypothetical protein